MHDADTFACCGGNDETPQEHTQDCHYSINRFVDIEIAAGAVIRNPGNKAALRRLKKAYESRPGSAPRMEAISAALKKRAEARARIIAVWLSELDEGITGPTGPDDACVRDLITRLFGEAKP